MVNSEAKISVSQGSGGRDMQKLLQDTILPILNNGQHQNADAATIASSAITPQGEALAFTTDSYTVSPRQFAGGDIGSLAVNGTVNDLACSGAIPRFLSCSLIIEEGLAFTELKEILTSMRQAADAAGVAIITGDTKVVPRGAADGLYINTAGIGSIPGEIKLGAGSIVAGDQIIVSGYLGDHGAAILCAREDLRLESQVKSDCRPIHQMVQALLSACPNTRFIRDATRGGVATVVNEIAAEANLGAILDEAQLPVRQAVRSTCELLGFDPLWLANEGTFIAVIPAASSAAALAALREIPESAQAAIIGRLTEEHHGMVAIKTLFGGERTLDMPSGELLPRIC